MKYDIVFQGFPGRMMSGTMGWSSMVYVESGPYKIIFDTAGPGKRVFFQKQLQKFGIDPKTINLLVLSHFHYDHVWNFDYFTNAKILMHAAEAEWVLSKPDNYPIPHNLYPMVKETGRLELVMDDKEIAPGIQTLLTPGHTPGNMALILQDQNMLTTVLAGDAVKNMAELASGNVTTGIGELEVMIQSIKKIRDIAKVVIPGHDRPLQVGIDKISALTACHETIVIPKGIADKDQPRYLELVLEPTSMVKEEIK